jgi:hypothetical protein
MTIVNRHEHCLILRSPPKAGVAKDGETARLQPILRDAAQARGFSESDSIV